MGETDEASETTDRVKPWTIPSTITRAAYSLMREHLRSLKAGRTVQGRRLTGETRE